MNALNKSSHNCVFNAVHCTTATTGTVHTQYTHKIQQKKPTQQLIGEPRDMQTVTSSLSHKESIQIILTYLLHGAESFLRS